MPSLGRSREAFDAFSAATELPMGILSVVWLVILVVGLLFHLSPSAADTVNGLDYSLWAVFAIEYLVKLYLAPARKHYFSHHLVDLAVVALPVLRPLRVLRLVRLLQFTRIGVVLANGVRRARDIFTHRGLHLVLLSAAVMVFVCAWLVMLFEHGAPHSNIHDYGQALWWAIVTVTTVGYGDKYPVTPGGRGVAVVLMLVGIGLIGALTATVASFFVEEQAGKQNEDLNERLDRIEAMLAQVVARDGGDPGAEGAGGSRS